MVMKMRYISVKRRTVRVSGGDGFALSEDEVTEIDEWVRENKIGIRTAYDMWKLDTDATVTLFLLRWN
jgi:hypothetical protein